MFQKNETWKALKEFYLMSNILRKIDQPSRRTTRRDYKHISHRVHIIQIPRAAPSFMGIWAIWSPLKIHCFTCMLFKTCWSRLIYTKLSSHRSFVRNMYVITMAWRCISPWSFHRSPQRRREMDIFQPPRSVCHSSIHWCQFLIVVIFYHKKYESAKSKMFDFFSFW